MEASKGLKPLVSMTPLLLKHLLMYTPLFPPVILLNKNIIQQIQLATLKIQLKRVSALRVNYTESIKTCRCPVSSEQRSDSEPAVSDVWPHDKPLARLPTGGNAGSGTEINAYFVFTKAN